MAENATHVVLSQDELASFAEDSFIVVDNVFTGDEVGILRQACSAPENQPWAQSERLIHSLELTVRHEAFSATGAGPAHRLAPVKPKAGGISIHHGLALHLSGSNPSGAPQRGIVFQYRADDAFQLADGVWKDTGIMICGQWREHVRCNAGVLRVPKSRCDLEHPFGHAWHQEGDFATEVNRRNGLQWIKEEGS
jgi:hypothetical protein